MNQIYRCLSMCNYFFFSIFILISTTSNSVFAENDSHGKVWTKLEYLAKQGISFEFSGNQDLYELGDKMKLSVKMPRKGYLNIISVDENDEATILFPNKYQQKNLIEKGGTVIFPDSDAKFEWVAMEPVGDNLIVVFITTKKLNMYMDSMKKNTFNDKEVFFTPLDESSLKGFGVVATNDKKRFASGKIVLTIE
jgi:hypothetical protein